MVVNKYSSVQYPKSCHMKDGLWIEDDSTNSIKLCSAMPVSDDKCISAMDNGTSMVIQCSLSYPIFVKVDCMRDDVTSESDDEFYKKLCNPADKQFFRYFIIVAAFMVLLLNFIALIIFLISGVLCSMRYRINGIMIICTSIAVMLKQSYIEVLLKGSSSVFKAPGNICLGIFAFNIFFSELRVMCIVLSGMLLFYRINRAINRFHEQFCCIMFLAFILSATVCLGATQMAVTDFYRRHKEGEMCTPERKNRALVQISDLASGFVCVLILTSISEIHRQGGHVMNADQDDHLTCFIFLAVILFVERSIAFVQNCIGNRSDPKSDKIVFELQYFLDVSEVVSLIINIFPLCFGTRKIRSYFEFLLSGNRFLFIATDEVFDDDVYEVPDQRLTIMKPTRS